MNRKFFSVTMCILTIVVLILIMYEVITITNFAGLFLFFFLNIYLILVILLIIFLLVRIIYTIFTKKVNVDLSKKMFYIVLIISIVLLPFSIYYYTKFNKIENTGKELVYLIEEYKLISKKYPENLDELQFKNDLFSGFSYSNQNTTYELTYHLGWYYLYYNKKTKEFDLLD